MTENLRYNMGEKISILTIGDCHFKVNNVQETDEMTKRLIELARQRQPKFIVLLGDILHRHETIHVVPLMGAEKLIKGLSEIAPVYICIGNHDRPNNSNFLTDEHPFNALKDWNNVFIADKVLNISIDLLREMPQDISVDKHKFLFVPYVPNGRFMEALNTIEAPLENTTAIFAHQEFYKAKMGAIISEVGDKWPLENPLVISGHIHDYDLLQPNVIYTGTPIQETFSENTQKTVSIFTFNPDKSWNQERVDLGLPKKITIYITPNEIHNFEPKGNTLIRLVIRGTEAELKAVSKLEKINELKKKGVKIALKASHEIKEVDKTQEIKPRVNYKDRLVSELNGHTLKWFHKIFV